MKTLQLLIGLGEDGDFPTLLPPISPLQRLQAYLSIGERKYSLILESLLLYISVVSSGRISAALEQTVMRARRKWEAEWAWRGKGKVEVVELIEKSMADCPPSPCFSMLFLFLLNTSRPVMWVAVCLHKLCWLASGSRVMVSKKC